MTGEQFLRRRADPSLLLTRKLLADARHREGEAAYTANLAFAIATGMILANWASLLVATLLVLIAHAPRIRFEETLLKQRFPNDYPTYTHQTGGLLPRLPRHNRRPIPR